LRGEESVVRMSSQPHSAEYFGDTRDFWWNRDFLELMSRRWRLQDVNTALDVGCGVGHWGRCLAPFLPAGSVLTGVDREARSVEEAQKRSAGVANVAMVFQVADAERLPFPDGAFDLVTCQTVLIHVKEPRVVIAEMIRVLAPGGLLVIVEPDNLAANTSDADHRRPVRDAVALIEFQLICERGKMNLGEGFNSAGPNVAGWLAEAGVEQIEAYLSDKITLLVPPYSSDSERAVVEEMTEMRRRNFWIWSEDDTRRYFLAGGGGAEDFGGFWDRAMARESELVDAMARGEKSVAFTPVCLVVSGRKPR